MPYPVKLRNSLGLGLARGGSAVLNYLYNYDGLTQYSALESPIAIPFNSDFELELYTRVYSVSSKKFVGTTSSSKGGLFGWEASGNFVLRPDSAWRLSQSSVPQTVGLHKINLKRISGEYSASVDDAAPTYWVGLFNVPVNIDFIGRAYGTSSYEYLHGNVMDIRLWTGGDKDSGSLVLSNSLSNKLSGAYQQALVGSNANIINYDVAGWTQI